MTFSIKRPLRHALLCLIAALAPLTLPAATINVPADQKTIQAGIDAASNGDTVLVAPGTYYENIDFKGKAITVTSSAGATSTTINGGRLAPTVVFAHDETRNSILSNLTITGGQGISSMMIGGIYLYLSSPTILSNIITANGCYGINSTYSSPLVQSNEISYTQNVPNGCGFASGAGIWLDGDQLNTPSLIPEVISNVIEQNSQSGLADAGGNGGGGIAVWAGTFVIADNIIRKNATGKYPSPTAGGVGGGIYFYTFSGGLVINNLIYGNTSNLAGGGIYVDLFGQGGGNLALINNTIVDNAVTNSSQTINNNQILGGQQIVYGPAGDPAVAGELILDNNIIGGSTAGASVLCNDGTANSIKYSHNNFYNDSGQITLPYEGTCTFPSGTNGNISVDPAFVAASSQNYHLLKSSPAVDTGDNAGVNISNTLGFADTTDLDSKPRLQDATGQGCTIDMGAYEYPGTTTDCSSATETFTSSLNPSLFGQNVTFTAQLSSSSGTPSGDVQFIDGTTVLGTVALSSTGSASVSTTSLTVGSHTVTANYLPSGTQPAATATLTQVVNGIATNTNLTSSLNPANVGQTVTFTATVASATGTPTGLVTFTDGATTLGTQTLVNGVASFPISTLSAGSHNITATYNPNGSSFAASIGSLNQVINGFHTTTNLTVIPTTASLGATISMYSEVFALGASVTSGNITYMDGATGLATITLAPNLIPNFNTSTLSVGTHTITAVYSGDATQNPSTSAPVTVTITSAVPTLSFSATPNPAFALQPIALSAKLAGLPAGTSANTITFFANGNAVGTAQTSAQGVATLTTALPAGTYSLTAAFAGTTGVSAVTAAPVTEIVNPNPTTAAVYAQPNPGYQGGNETLTASVTTQFASGNAAPPVPTGTVTFFDSGSLIGTSNLDVNGQAAFATNTLAVGSHSLTAVYAGTPNFLTSTSQTYTLAILPRDFTLTTDPTITIQTQHHKDLNLTLSSVGDFTDTIALSCGNLPVYASCTFASNGQLLIAGATQASFVHVDTDALLNYISSNVPASHPHGGSRLRSGVAYGLLLPVILIATMRRRRSLQRFLGLLLLLVATTLTGCSGHYPGHTPPGTYTFTVTGQGATTHIIHTATVTLIVTE